MCGNAAIMISKALTRRTVRRIRPSSVETQRIVSPKPFVGCVLEVRLVHAVAVSHFEQVAVERADSVVRATIRRKQYKPNTAAVLFVAAGILEAEVLKREHAVVVKHIA